MKQHLLVILIGLMLAACGGKKEQIPTSMAAAKPVDVKSVVGIASIEPAARIIQLTTESAGVVKTVHVHVGQDVRQGDLLYSLTDEVELAQVNQAASKLTTQQAIIESQQATLGAIEVQLANAGLNLQRTQKLFEGKAATQQQLDDSQFVWDNFSKQKVGSEANLRQQVARKSELQADLRYYESLRNRKHVRAPVDGTILSVEARIGNYVNTAALLGEFAPSGGWVAVTEIDELFADRVKLGQHAYFRPQGDSVVLGRGDVVLISPYLRKKSLFSDNASNFEDRRVREVRVKVAPDAKMLIGSRVECVIELQ